MKYGFVVSDLFVFSDVAKNCDIIKSIEVTSRRADFLILNGDIFDFSNTNSFNVIQKLDNAEKLLKRFVKNSLKRNIVYVFGRNDRYAPFIERLQKIAEEFDNLKIFNVYAKIGENMFIHGDWLEHNSQPQLLLQKKKNIIKRSWQKIINKFFYVRRITKFINNMQKQNEVKKVFFGQIQKPFINYHYKGIEFNNTGAAIANSKSLMIHFEVDDNAIVEGV